MSTVLLLFISFRRYGAEIVVNKEEYMKVTSEALNEVEHIVETVDTDCLLYIDSGKKPKIHLETLHKEGPRLCLVNGTYDDKNTVAILMLVNSVEYLQEQLGNWLSFLNKAAYCYKTQRPLYIWIGDLDPSILDRRHIVPWLNCFEKTKENTLNIYKTIAILATFKKRREIKYLRRSGPVMYLDADAWFSDTAFAAVVSPESFLNVSSRAFLFGNQNRIGGPKIPMNGGVLALKDTARSRRFLALWFFSRCGLHDQLPLWATLFATWAIDANTSIKTNTPHLFSEYTNMAQSQAILTLVANLPTFRRPILQRDPQNSYNGGNFEQTQLLDRPLELPGVLLLPSAPIPERALPALRSDFDKSRPTFCCHTRIDKDEEGQCRGNDICAHSKCMPFLRSSSYRSYLRKKQANSNSWFFSFSSHR